MSDFWDSLPEQPSEQREEMILHAIEEGQHDPIVWTPVGVGLEEGVEVLLNVSSDALMLDGVRVNVTMTTMQKIVDVLGHAFPTSKISDLIRQHADALIGACTQTPDAKMAYTSRMIQHSRAVDAKLAGNSGLACTIGKDWVLSNKLVNAPDKSANYGWHDPAAKYTSPGGLKLWQNLGLAHDRWHVDYSQVVRLISRNCLLNGEPRDLMELLQDPKLSKLLSYEGPLQLTRMPGVPIYKPLTPSPAVAGGTLGERCVAWCLQHVGEQETPPGSNDSPLIRSWLAPCARGYGDKRVVLGISKMNWCSSFQCAAVRACLRPGEKQPHDYRAGVVELVEDTYNGQDGLMPFAGRYVPIELTRNGEFWPSVGDLVIWDRSDPSKPETAWYRHVNRVVKFTASEGTFQTVGGNEGQRVMVSEHHVSSAKLLGWIHYPVPSRPQVEPPMLSDADREQILNNVGMFLRETADTIWGSKS